MKRLHKPYIVIASCLATASLMTACAVEDDFELAQDEEFDVKSDEGAAVDDDGRAPGILVSAELFDLASRWSSESLSALGTEKATTMALGTDLVEYVRLHAPEMVTEATAAVETMDVTLGDGPVSKADTCACSIWGNFVAPTSSLTGDSWHMSTRGAAHYGDIYQAESGSTRERDARPAPTSTKLRTRIVCTTPTGAACAAGCSAQLYADAYYATQLYAEAHVWTIWNRAGTTQVVDGVTLDLRTPYSGSQRLRQKAASVHHYSNNKAFQPEDLANVIEGGLAIYLAFESGSPGSLLSSNVLNETVNGIFGLINSGTSNNDGSHSAGMKMEFESYFDTQPIVIDYQSNTNLVYGLDLTSELAMRVRGWGYHSETGTATSSYALAAYIDNFVCATGVTPPRRTGFWNYDGYDGSPMSLTALRDEIRSFFYMGYGAWVDVSASTGTLVQGVCGNDLCESLESPSTCSSDCGYCGNGVCNAVFETASTCRADCGYCGDGVCYGGETVWGCRADCGYCGDGVCYGSETSYNCSSDCDGGGDGDCEPYLQQDEFGTERIMPCPL